MIRRFLPFAALVAVFLCLQTADARQTQVFKAPAVATVARSSNLVANVWERDTRTWSVVASTTSGAGSVTFTVDGSMDGVNWVPLIEADTLTLSTTAAIDAFTDSSAFAYYSLNVTAISGTGASAQLVLGQ